MKIDLYRKYRKANYTIGILSIDGQRICETIEDVDRGLTDSMPLATITSKKVYGKTAIPTGTYKVRMTYSNRFKKVLPLLDNVKGFEGIRIHSGNTAADTEGCILPGKNTKVGMVTDSRNWTNVVIEHIKMGLERGPVTINIHW